MSVGERAGWLSKSRAVELGNELNALEATQTSIESCARALREILSFACDHTDTTSDAVTLGSMAQSVSNEEALERVIVVLSGCAEGNVKSLDEAERFLAEVITILIETRQVQMLAALDGSLLQAVVVRDTDSR